MVKHGQRKDGPEQGQMSVGHSHPVSREGSESRSLKIDPLRGHCFGLQIRSPHPASTCWFDHPLFKASSLTRRVAMLIFLLGSPGKQQNQGKQDTECPD